MRISRRFLGHFLGTFWIATVAGASNPPGAITNDPARLASYDVVWDTPSQDDSGSLPLGNGEVGVNAWIEPNGTLCFYISRTDAWDDNGRLVKIGKVRITLQPNPLAPGQTFQQRLSLVDATMRASFGTGDAITTIGLWVDANQPVVRIEVDASKPVEAIANVELWRNQPQPLPSLEISDAMYDPAAPGFQHEPVVVEPDTVLTNQSGRVGWFHHNRKSVGPSVTARIQGVADFARPDPLLHRTFGALILADGGQRDSDTRLRSPSANRHSFRIFVSTQHPSTPEAWLQHLEQSVVEIETIPASQHRAAHEQWWREFWERSWIHIGAGAQSERAAEALDVSRAYALQRFINASNGRGRYPIKFNGSIFSVSYPGRPGNADYRLWGPGYWWQNTRLPYYSMSASGDFDLMQPLFNMYARDLIPLFRFRTRRQTGHDGAFIPETIYFWGDVFSVSYGWTPFEDRADKLQEGPWHKWVWVPGEELVWLMLDYCAHTMDDSFLRESVLPTAHEILTFFDQQYPTNAAGKLVMSPAQALETWWDCTNPMPELAGLHALTERLLSLPSDRVSADERVFWTRLQNKLPDLPTRVANGMHLLAAADRFANKQNVENPELYAVFPFRQIAVGRPNLDLGIQALNQRTDRGNFGWRQDDIFMAYLGLAEPAREYLVGRARTKHNGSRFLAFWGPNYDWVPDQTHGGVLMQTLQSMILQSDGSKIFLLPAWPSGWDVSFKLHAPFQTIVRGAVQNGRLTQLDVTPAERRKDVFVLGPGAPANIELSAAPTNVLAGQTLVVPLTVSSSAALSQLSFKLGTSSGLLFQPRWLVTNGAIADAPIAFLGPNLFQLTLFARPGTSVTGTMVIGELALDTLASSASAVCTITASELTGRDSQDVALTNAVPREWPIVVVGERPLLLPDRASPAIVLYARPNRTYFLDERSDLDGGSPWGEFRRLDFGNETMRRIEGVPGNRPASFYRARWLP